MEKLKRKFQSLCASGYGNITFRCLKQGKLLCILVTVVFITVLVTTSMRGISFHSVNLDRARQSHKTKVTADQTHSTPIANVKPLKAPYHKQLMLVTYGRSGSSFTSGLVSNHPDVFYSFEPLYALQKRHVHSKGRNSSLRQYSRDAAIKIVYAFLSCNFTVMNALGFANFHLISRGPEMNKFYHCARAIADGYKHISCFLKMVEACQRKPTTFAKVIRFSMSWAQEVLDELPGLKILYLVRDPRAVLYSQSKVFKTFVWPKDIQKKATFHCGSLVQDVKAIDTLTRLHPGRVKLIRYEHGAVGPVEYTKDIYKFAGLEFSAKTMAHIQSVTHASGSENKNPYSLVKSNSVAAANKWRSRVKYEDVRVVDSICGHVYPSFGYKTVSSKSHLQSNVSLFEIDFHSNITATN